MLCENMVDMIGKTPLLRLKRIEEKYGLKGKLWAKVEGMNPAGSTKDRASLGMIRAAELFDGVEPGATFVEPTSGNTGIGIAAIAAARGYKAIIVMPDSMSKERIKLMEVYGAEVVLTPAAGGMAASIEKAKEICEQIEGARIVGQFDNPANPREHYRTTGPEIYRDLGGKVDVFVAGIGTGGTFSGATRFLKDCNPDIYAVAVEPASSPLLSGGEASSHKIQGIGANFVPANYEKELADEILTIEDDEALEMFRVLPRTEGIFAGISSGAALSAAIKVASRPENEDKNIVVVLPDNGDRYLSLV